jgi:hypothetical protein
MHTIRLREPWQAAWLESNSQTDRTTAYQRKFHQPTGLEASQGVLLVVALKDLRNSIRVLDRHDRLPPQSGSQAFLSASLNSTALALECLSSGLLQGRVETLLQPFNLLEIRYTTSAGEEARSAPRLFSQVAEVRLEILD